MQIRRARPEESDEIAAVFGRSFGTLLTFLPELHTPEEHRQHFAGVVREQEVWVAEEDGRILGFAAVDDEPMLNYLYVDPDAHGRGVGGALLDKAKERRPQGMTLWAFQQNENARRFYERRGFRLVRLTDGAANEEQVPDALYEWRPAR